MKHHGGYYEQTENSLKFLELHINDFLNIQNDIIVKKNISGKDEYNIDISIV